MIDFKFKNWFEGSDLPSEIQGTLFARGLNRNVLNNNAVKMSQELDKKHTKDIYWQKNVENVKNMLNGVPFIHIGKIKGVILMWEMGIMPSEELVNKHIIKQEPLEFDKISGLDKVTFYRQGQPGGKFVAQDLVGILIDPKKLDPHKLIITKLGFMTLKAKEDNILRKPGDHSKLVDAQLRRYRQTTINYEDMPTIQAKLLVDGYLSSHPQENNRILEPEKVIANDQGEMEIKYIGTIKNNAMIGFIAPTQAVSVLVKAGIPQNAIKTYDGNYEELENTYRKLYLKHPTKIDI